MGGCHGAILRRGLGGQMMNAGQAVLNFPEGDEDLLAVLGHGLLVGGLGAFVVGAVAASGKDGQRQARSN